MSTIIHTFFRKSLLNTEHHRGGRSHPPMFHRFESACLFCFGKRTLLSTGVLYNASRAFLRDFSTVDAVSPYAQENAINAGKTQQQGVSGMRAALRLRRKLLSHFIPAAISTTAGITLRYPPSNTSVSRVWVLRKRKAHLQQCHK